MRHVNVLIAADDALVRRDLKALLGDLGHTVIGEADTGPRTLALARSQRPDLVLLQTTIPLISGLDIAQTLCDEAIAPTLLLAGVEGSSEAPERIERCGAMGYFVLPLKIAEFGPAIQIATARWQRITELDAEVRALNERMEARKLVGRAKAILMERFNLQEREAFRRIQAQSASLNKPVHEIARAIVTAHHVSV